jgi:hypothetical protein
VITKRDTGRLFLTCAFLAGLADAQSIAVQNPSFETATLAQQSGNGAFSNLIAGSTFTASPAGGTLANWTAASTTLNAAAGAFAPTPGGNNWTTPWWTGNNIAYLQIGAAGTVSLSQTLPTLLQNNTTYSLTALVGRRAFTPAFNFSFQLWAGSTELGSSSLNLPSNSWANALVTYDTGTNNPLAGQPLMIVLSATGTDGTVTEAFFDNIAMTAASDLLVTKILPQLAFGGGWYTALYFTNTTTNPVSFTVNFNANDGTPLTVPALNGSSVPVSLTSRGTILIEAPNGPEFSQGYVTAALPAGVTGFGVFRQSVPGVPDQEAVVPLSGNTATISTLLFDDTKNKVTAFAIVNLDSQANTMTAVARDTQGNTIGTGLIQLAANAKTTMDLFQLIPGVTGALGSVDFTAGIGNVAVLGLRFNGHAFTSIPTSDR